MPAKPPPQERLRQLLGAMRVPPAGTAAKKLRPLAEAAFRDPVVLQAFRKALDGQVDAAASFAEALRPGWRCTIEEAPPQEGAGPHVIARLRSPEESADAPESWAARPAGHPAFALVVATLESFAPGPGLAAAPPMEGPLRGAVKALIALAIAAVLLVLAAAFAQALWEVFIESWS